MIVALMIVFIVITPYRPVSPDDRLAGKPDFPLLVGEREPWLRVHDLSKLSMVEFMYSTAKSVFFYSDFRLIIGLLR